MQSREIPLDQLLLDPNNYRLQESDTFMMVNTERFSEEGVQDRTLTRLGRHSLRELVNSIRSNGFLEIERIVVTPYEHDDEKFLVIEGNRRIAALRILREEHRGGIDVPDQVIATFDAVPCLVADNEGEAFFKEALMGIRHVGGIKEWGGFQRAKLIADLRDGHDLEAGEVADRLGMHVQEVNRRYRAYKCLQQMQNDEEYGEYANPAMYPIFHEAVSLPVLREWAGWDAATNAFKNDENRDLFYSLITPHINEEDPNPDAEPAQPKIKSYGDVRQLRDILPNDEARACLLQDDKSLLDAQTIAKRDEISRKWRSEVGEASTALKKISAIEVEGFDDDDLTIINALVETAKRVIAIHKRLKGG
ncbi:ParB N-terminal domain-containing protein [Altererythrobacter sp. H2]|uniref:ParB N-terminal domain-containing protein n=1 Tax=Altererythrobacter sp. H2 TaxID=3108391 RepID=UPI002B4BCBD3|nr:ParB N-terminal domain-containing protein [Altererythrobacter sp. H2]WRK95105.1 ParB N-terminal domain-containing protein [Altererythrobacter sp. H2]